MLILGIESSCDDTGVALLNGPDEVLYSQVASQWVHERFGGVVPEIAAREHLVSLDPLVNDALSQAKVAAKDIDLIAVTAGPGLVGCLLVGACYAKGLATRLGKPLVPINHVRAHVHGALLGIAKKERRYPLLALVVSGGHTHLYAMASPTEFELVAHSLDDACGESFDKVAKLLGLGYPGGPVVEKQAKQGDPKRYPMPTPVKESARMAFSYSGLKTHIVNLLRQEPLTTAKDKADLCASFQQAALNHLTRKLAKAIEQYPDTEAIVISGGVSANQAFRRLAEAELRVPVHFPALAYCSDNAAMIASLGYYQFQQHRAPSYSSWDVFSSYPYSSSSTAG